MKGLSLDTMAACFKRRASQCPSMATSSRLVALCLADQGVAFTAPAPGGHQAPRQLFDSRHAERYLGGSLRLSHEQEACRVPPVAGPKHEGATGPKHRHDSQLAGRRTACSWLVNGVSHHLHAHRYGYVWVRHAQRYCWVGHAQWYGWVRHAHRCGSNP